MDELLTTALQQKQKLAQFDKKLAKMSKKRGIPLDDFKWLLVIDSLNFRSEMPIGIPIKDEKGKVVDKQEITVLDECLNGYTLEETLGSGSYGTTAKACYQGNCEYAIKVQYLPNQEASQAFDTEVYLSNLFSLNGVGPKYLGGWNCTQQQLGLLATELWDGELPAERICGLNPDLIAKLLYKVRKIHELGYVHGDILPKNILIREKDGEIIDLTLTDFGISDSIDAYQKNIDLLAKLYVYYAGTALNKYFQKYDIRIKHLRQSPQLLDYALLYLLQLPECNPNVGMFGQEILVDIDRYLSSIQRAEMIPISEEQMAKQNPSSSLKIPIPIRDERGTLIIRDKPIKVDKACLRGYELKKFLGGGAYGAVAKACKELSDDCKYAIKIQYLKYPRDTAIYDKEVYLIQEFQKIGVGPMFYGAWKCPEQNLGLIVSELWDGELSEAELCLLSEELVMKLFDQVERIHGLGYVHMDIFPWNILVNKNEQGEIIDATIADFGLTRKRNTVKKVDATYARYTNPELDLEDYFLDLDIFKDDVLNEPYLFDYALLYNIVSVCNHQNLLDIIIAKVGELKP